MSAATDLVAGLIDAPANVLEAQADVLAAAEATNGYAYRYEQLEDGSIVEVRVNEPRGDVRIIARTDLVAG